MATRETFGVPLTHSRTRNVVVVFLDDGANSKMFSLKVLYDRFSVTKVQKVICIENGIDVPFKFLASVELSNCS